jgi:hypothetical protein
VAGFFLKRQSSERGVRLGGIHAEEGDGGAPAEPAVVSGAHGQNYHGGGTRRAARVILLRG